MTRRNAAARLLVGVPYAILYVVVLFPLALAVGVLVGLVAVVYHLVTGSVPERLVATGDRLWSWVGGNMRWTLFGRGDFAWTP